MTAERAKAIDKAQKVFVLGVRTPFHGEKESCYQRLVFILQQYNLVLSDLSPTLPRRLDTVLLRVQIGLPPGPAKGQAAGAGAPGAKGPAAGASAKGPKPGPAGGKHAETGQNQRSGPTGGTSGQQRQEQAGAGRANAGSSGKASANPSVLLFQHLEAAERRRALHGPLFSRGLLEVLKRAGAYAQLLGELHTFNKSGKGVAMSDHALLELLDRVLSRQGSKVKCQHKSRTIFDDIVSHCRFEYISVTQRQRQEKEQAAAARKRQEEEARQAKAKRDAEQRQREEEARQQAAPEPDDAVFDFEASFDVLAEAQLYIKVVRRIVTDPTKVSSVTRAGEFIVSFTGTDAVDERIAELYARALHDLQQAAEMIRMEAARAREEALVRVEAEYVTRCEQAFQVAVKQYRA